jgi:hypothetical protein
MNVTPATSISGNSNTRFASFTATNRAIRTNAVRHLVPLSSNPLGAVELYYWLGVSMPIPWVICDVQGLQLRVRFCRSPEGPESMQAASSSARPLTFTRSTCGGSAVHCADVVGGHEQCTSRVARAWRSDACKKCESVSVQANFLRAHAAPLLPRSCLRLSKLSIPHLECQASFGDSRRTSRISCMFGICTRRKRTRGFASCTRGLVIERTEPHIRRRWYMQETGEKVVYAHARSFRNMVEEPRGYFHTTSQAPAQAACMGRYIIQFIPYQSIVLGSLASSKDSSHIPPLPQLCQSLRPCCTLPN